MTNRAQTESSWRHQSRIEGPWNSVLIEFVPVMKLKKCPMTLFSLMFSGQKSGDLLFSFRTFEVLLQLMLPRLKRKSMLAEKLLSSPPPLL